VSVVRGNVCEDAMGSKLTGNILVGVEFLDEQGAVIKGPFFGVTDAQGDYVIFIDPITVLENDKLNLKACIFHGGRMENMISPFLTYHGLDPQNNL